MFNQGAIYTRKSIWNEVCPGRDYPNGGNWNTGYARQNGYLFVFANVGVPGRTGHDFPNRYIEEDGRLVWYGKPDAHSAQDTFIQIFRGDLPLHVFVRWNSHSPNFTYLGQPHIESWRDGVQVSSTLSTIEVVFSFDDESSEGFQVPPTDQPKTEGKKSLAIINRYERDPKLRLEAINRHGLSCMACGFNFERVYGELGSGFIHVHHLNPLGEVGQQHNVDPVTDLAPLCPNCHSMVHRRSRAISIQELRTIIAAQS